MPAHPMEPFRIKMVERLVSTTREQRAAALQRARYNLFRIPSELVRIDLLTDSGTAAMSDGQWSALLRGDESYAGSRSFYRFEEVVRDLFGFEHVIPTHQGRAAEHLLFSLLLQEGDAVVSNNHFDTTRANIEARGGLAIDCVTDCAYVTDAECPFKGQIDLAKLNDALSRHRVVLGMATLTNNTGGGQPVSLKNLREVAWVLRNRGLPFILDACRFAENAYFIQRRERPDLSIRQIAREMCALADGCIVSAKKDGLANIGGFFACRSAELAEQFKQRLILVEGFPTYGGLAGRDLEAIAVGLEEVVDPAYLEYRVGQVRYLAERLDREGVPIVKPPGGHAVFLDARKFLPGVPPEQFPAQALACALYVEGGVRSCELGSLMFAAEGRPAKLDLVRLAIPRRVYTASHLDCVAESILCLYERRHAIRGLRLVRDVPVLRHFTAELDVVAG
ncbi:MAG: tryptophanase [Planctomycetes bacterium]|nr:tryptophanase [Planctomycetota bacterium]